MNIEIYKRLVDKFVFDGVAIVDQEKKIIYWNKGAELITGFTKDQIINTPCCQYLKLKFDEQNSEFCNEDCLFTDIFTYGASKTMDVHCYHKDNSVYNLSIRISPIKNEKDNTIDRAIMIFNHKKMDSELLGEIESLKKAAFLDTLTNIPNRRYTETVIKARLEEFQRYNWKFGILFIDIDHFKPINDQYGHKLGDIALKEVASTIQQTLRQFDLVGRWGGEEFIAVSVNVDSEILFSVAERIRKQVEKIEIPATDNTKIKLTVSMGATVAEQDDTFESLIERADKLMYKSKNDGRNRISI